MRLLRLPSLLLAAAAALLPISAGAAAMALPACDIGSVSVIQAGGGTYTTIAAAIANIPPTLSALTGSYCIDIQDSATYNEASSMTVVALTNAGHFIVIGPQNSANHPTVVGTVALGNPLFSVNNSSVVLQGMNLNPPGGSLAGYAVNATVPYVFLSSVNITAPAAGYGTAAVSLGSWSQIANSLISGGSGPGVVLSGAQGTTITYSTVTNTSVSLTLSIVNGSTNTVSYSFLSNAAGPTVNINASPDNVIAQTTVTAAGVGNIALNAQGSSNETHLNQDYLYSSLFSAGYFSTSFDTISQSSVIAGGSSPALYLFSGSNDTVTQSYLQNTGTSSGLRLNGTNAQVTLSTAAAVAYNAMDITGASNSVGQSVMISGGGSALSVTTNGNTITQSSITATAGGMTAAVVSGNSNSITQSFINGGLSTGLLFFSGGSGNSVSQSTITSQPITSTVYALALQAVTGTSVSNCYVQGSTAVAVQGSTNTSVLGSVLVSTNANGAALVMDNGGSNLTLKADTFLGAGPIGQTKVGVYLDLGGGGLVDMSTNTVGPGFAVDVFVDTQVAGTFVYMSSNTILPSLSNVPAINTYGILLNGLQTGATIQNNTISYRFAGSLAATLQTFAFSAQTTRGVRFDHNRIDQPGKVLGGQFFGASLSYAQNTTFKFNDLHGVTLNPNAGGVLLDVNSNSANLSMRDNIFFSSFTLPNTGAGLSSATVRIIDPGSQGGFSGDYNDFYSSNAYMAFQWSAGNSTGLANWAFYTAQETHSISAHPYWADTFPGIEDFHPLSAAGRWNQALGNMSFVDGVTSLTIDAGDTAEPFANEPLPNGGRVNQGSYGGSPQASESSSAPYPGCVYTARVGAGQTFATIGAGVAAIPHAPTPLTGRACVVVMDSAFYNEQVDVRNFNNGTSTITIFADVGMTPTVVPPANSTAAFVVANSSVSIWSINVLVNVGQVPYGVVGSSPNLSLASMNISSSGVVGIYTAGIALNGTSGSVAQSTVSVGNANALLVTASGASVSYSSFTNASGAFETALFNGASSCSVSNDFFYSASSAALALINGANYNTVSFTTAVVAPNAVNYPDGLRIVASSGNFVNQSYFASGLGNGAWLLAGSYNNTIAGSTLYSNYSGTNGLLLVNASSNTFTGDTIVNGGDPVYLAGSSYNTIAFSTVQSLSNGNEVVLFNFSGAYSSSNSITHSYLYNAFAGGRGITANGKNNYNSISFSTIVAYVGVSLQGASGFSLTQSVVNAGNAAAFEAFPQGTAYPSNETIAGSTLTNNAAQTISLQQTSSVTVTNSYVQGPGTLGLISISGSTGTLVAADALLATGGAAVQATGGTVNVFVGGSVFLPGTVRAVEIDQYCGGSIVVSSNTLNFDSSGFGVSVGTANAGSTVWVSSNLFLANLGTNFGNTALSIDGLTTGATIQYNSFWYRNFGTSAQGYATIYAVSSPGLAIHHNRINQNGTMSGPYAAIQLIGSPNGAIRYNDLNVNTGAASPQVALVYFATGSAGGQVIGNAFNGTLNNGTTATLYVDGTSQAGFYANYNDYYTFSGAVHQASAFCGGTPVPLTGPWTCGGGPLLDANSVTGDPQWASTGLLLEDFHPRAPKGRWNPGTGSFVNVDISTSPLIDAGDPKDDYSLEPMSPNNGGRVNIGSYGDTPEASQSAPTTPYPGCVGTVRVGSGQRYGSIQQALNSFPTTLGGGSYCVVVMDTATYVEQVTVTGFSFTDSVSSIAFIGDPSLSLRPVVSPPPGATAAFLIQNASVSVSGFAIVPAQAVTYGIYAAAPDITLSSITLLDPNGFITSRGVSLSSYDSLRASTIAVWGANTRSVVFDSGGSNNLVLFSSLTANGVGGEGLDIFSSSNIVSSATIYSNGYAMMFEASAGLNSVTDSSITTHGGYNIYVVGSSNTFSRDNVVGTAGGGVIFEVGSTSTTFDQMSVSVNYGGNPAVSVRSSSNTIKRSFINGNNGGGVWVGNTGPVTGNLVSLTTITVSGGNVAATIANASSSNTFSQSVISNLGTSIGIIVSGVGTTGNLIVASTVTAQSGDAFWFSGSAVGNEMLGSFVTSQSGIGVHIIGPVTADNVVLQSSVTAYGSYAFSVDSLALSSVISQSTLTSNGGSVCLYIQNASSNIVDHSLLQGLGTTIQVRNGSNNIIRFSSITTNSASNGSAAYTEDTNGASNAITNSWLSANGGWAYQVSGSQYPSVNQSTMTNAAPFFGQVAVRVDQSTGASFTNDYVTTQSTGVVIFGSTNTVFVGDIVAAGGYGVRVGGLSSGLQMTQTLLTPQNNGSGAGLYLDAGNTGVVDVSTNIFMPGPTYQVFVATPGAGATVSFSSNTFYPNPTGPVDFYGLYLVGVNGASIQNNSFYYHGGDQGAGNWNRVALFAQSAANLNIVHNRIDDPNVVSNNDVFSGISFVATTGSTIKFNDINGSGSPLKNATLLSLTGGSTGNTVKDNVFSAAFAGVALNNDLVFVDAASASGLAFDYNDYFSANGNDNALCGGSSFPLTGSWACGGTMDVDSISSDPLWVNVSSGSEDFHPKSQAGHFPTFVNDGVTSPTIDAGDPAEPNNLEPTPNGALVNQGSYGDTAEASKTPAGPCATTRKVCKTGSCSNRSIQTALNSLPTTLTGYTCVLIEDSATYAENVKIAGFNMNGSSLTVMLDPSLAIAHPVIAPTSSLSPGLKIADSSVTISGIDFSFNGVPAIPYGISVTSAYVTISSVSVFDPFNDISVAGIAISSYDAVAYSTVSVNTADGIYADGTGASILNSSITVTGNAALAGHYGLYLNGASSTTISGLTVAMNGAGDAANLYYAVWTAISLSSFTSASAIESVYLYQANGASISQSYLYNNAGVVLRLAGDNWVGVSQSTVAGHTAGDYAVRSQGFSTVWSRVNVYSDNGGAIFFAGSGNSFSSGTVSAATINGVAIGNENGFTLSYSSISGGGGADAVYIYGGGADNTVVASTLTAAGAANYALNIAGPGPTRTLVTRSILRNTAGGATMVNNVSSNTISFSSITTVSGSAAVTLQSASTTTLLQDYIGSVNNNALFLDSGASYNYVQGSTIATPGNAATNFALFIQGAAHTSVSTSDIYGGLAIDVSAHDNSVILSTMIGGGGTQALQILTGSSNTVTQSYLFSPSLDAADIGNGAGASFNSISQSQLYAQAAGSRALSVTAPASTNTFSGDYITSKGDHAVYFQNVTSNTITLSTMTTYSGVAPVLEFFSNASSNAVTQSYAANVGGGFGAIIQSGSNNNVFTSDTFFANGGNAALTFNGADQNKLSQSNVIGGAVGVLIQGTNFSAVAGTTIQAGGIGLAVRSSSGAALMGDYVQGSTAVWINASTATALGAGQFYSVSNGGYGVLLDGGSHDLAVSSSIVSGGAMGAGIMISTANSGAVVIASNTILTGPQYGIYLSTMLPGSPQVVVSSNTIFPTVTTLNGTCGLCMNGLITGAAVTGNSIYYRSLGSMGANATYGMYALSSTNLQIDHNRISNPGMISAGGYVGAIFYGSSAQFKFNDLFMSGSGIAYAYGLQAVSAGALTVKDNAFVNGEVNPSSYWTVAVFVDANSETGYSADYNDYFFEGSGVQSFLGAWGAIPGSHPNTLSAWTTLTSQDVHSVVGDPLWANIVPGSEDFHLKSGAVNGRFNPATQTFSIQDSSGSPAIDAADPAEPFNREPSPNGLLANAGSYGDTPEASKTSPLPGCGVEYTVAPGGGANYTSINQALTAVPLIGTALASDTCIVITAPGVISEEVDVYGIIPNNHRLIIMGHPNLSSRAVIDPTGNPEAFLITNDSVTLKNLDIKPSLAANYGVLATSASLTLTGVNVDSGGKIGFAGLFVTTGATIVNSSVTVQNAYALQASGKGLTVAQSSFTNSAAFQEAVLLTGASNGSITQTLVANTAAWYGLGISSGANGNAISFSTVTSAGPSVSAFYINASSFNSVSNSVIGDAAGSGAALTGGAYGNSIVASTLSGNLAGGYALRISGSSNTVATSILNNPPGIILQLSGGGGNAVTLSTATGTTGPSLQVNASSGNVFTQDYFGNPGVGSAATFINGSAFNQVDQTTFNAVTPTAVTMNQASSNTFTRCVFVAGLTGTGVNMTAADSNYFAQDAFLGGNGSVYAAYLFGSSSNTFTQSVFTQGTGNGSAIAFVGFSDYDVVSYSSATSSGHAGVYINNGIGDVVAFSTAVGKFGIDIPQSTGTVIAGSYVAGSTGVVINGSEGTVIGGSVLVSTAANGFAVSMTGGSNGLQLSSSVVIGGSNRGGLYLDNGNAGLIVVSTNIFTSSASVSIFLSTSNAGTAVWITSNTFQMAPSLANSPQAIWLNGLATGVTIQNNSFLVRNGGVMGGTALYAIYAQNSAGVDIDHNRFSDPALLSGGTYTAVFLDATPATVIKFNDFNAADAAGALLTNAYQLQLLNSPNAVVRDNVFASSLTVTGSSATITLDVASQTGYSGDYNDFFSSAGLSSILWGVAASSFPWSASFPADAHSIAYNPRWASVVPGAEDFHPLSNAGRFVTGVGFNGGDGWSAATIDAADTAEGTGQEPGPNGGRGNLGSYGLTLEASKTPGAPTAPNVTAVSSTSVTVTFGPVGSAGQAVVASTSPSFSNPVSSGTPTTQNNLAPQGLVPNTTYYLEAGALWGDLFVPNGVVMTSATLAAAPAGNPPGSFANVSVSSITALWQPNGNPLNVTTYTVVFTTGPVYPNTDAGNVTLSTTPVGNPPTAAYGSLNPNTTYFVYAAAINVASQPSVFTLLGATATVPAAPVFVLPSFLAASSSTLTVAWGANGDPVGVTTFTVVASTAANFNAGASSVTFSTCPATGPTATAVGLSANTTYFFEARAEGSDGQSSGWLQFGSTSTLAEPPVIQTLSAASTSQIDVVYTAPGDPLGTQFVVQTATSVGFTGIVTSSFTYSLSASTAGLQANTAYFFRVAALNNVGVATAFLSTGALWTLALPPATVTSTFPAVAASSMSVAWSANGNRAGTNYFVVLSTDSLFNVYATSFTQSTAPAGANLSATFNGLAGNTTYYLRVQAVSFGGIPTVFTNLGSTTTTPPNLLPPSVQTFTSITTGTITATWTLMPGATGYALAASTDPTNPPTLVWTSSSPVGLSATTATLSGLAPNTTYFLFVQALGPGAVSLYSAFPATSTFVSLPVSAASTFSGVNFTSVTVSWGADADPLAMTTYTVVASTASDFNLYASSVVFSTVPAAGPSATLTGMLANTTYYFEVQALGNGATATAFVALGSTTTPVGAPAAAAQTFVVATSTELVVAWSAGLDPLARTTYTVVASTASDFNAGAVSVTLTTAPAAGPSAYFGGLLVNTTYFIEVAALGVNGSSSGFVVLGSTSTGAVAPGAAAFSGVSAGAITANWTAGPDPAWTQYALQTSTSPAFTGVVTTSFTYNLAVSSAGLAPNTTYYFRAQALNNDGVATGYTSLGATATFANPPLPVGVTFTMVGVSSVTLNWNANGNPLAFTTYTIVASTAANFNAFASSVTFSTVPVAGPTATFPGLAFGTTWYFEVLATNPNGIPTAYANLGSTYTVLSNLVPLIVNFQGGDAVWRSNDNGMYNVQFQDGSGLHLDKFQVKASTSPNGTGTDLIAFTDVAINLSPADSYTSKWALPAAVYNAMIEGVTNYVTVRVYNGVPSTSTLQDAFFVLKDTTPPVITNNAAGGDPVVRSTATSYDVRAKDLSSGLGGFQYSASLVKLSGDQSLVPWTNIAVLNGATSYTTPWALNAPSFAALPSGVTSYITVRAFDVAGNTTTVVDAFYILKDTVGPTVAISSPVVGSGYVSALGTFVGTSSSPFPVQGTEVAVLDVAANLYWNPGASLFNSGAALFMVAAGSPTWTLSPGIPFVDGKAYKIVARSSSTYNFYSTVYATAAFVVDFGTPTVGVQAPVPNSTVGSLPVISGTALDPGGNPSGLSSVQVQLERLSDGKFWNWFTQTWGVVAVSTVPTGTTSWSLAPTPLLLANLTTNSSYYIAVSASDNATPPNQGNFFTQGATFTYSNPVPPAPVSDLFAVGGILPGQIQLTWHATGENGSSGIILSGQYSVFYATYAAAPASTAAAQVAFATSTVSPGAASVFTVGGLSAGVTYYLQIALQNTDGNWSGFSNQASTVATPAPLNAIEGHVVNSSTQGITGVEVDAWNNAGALVSTTFTLADGSGTYIVGGLSPGAYKLQASWTVNGVTSSVWQDSIPMGTVGVDYSLEINYALATLTGSLATLTTSSARTGSSPAALARPAAGGSYVEVYQRGRSITKVGVQPSGRWNVPNLLPGAYSVRAFTGVSLTPFQDVNLQEGQTMTIGFVFDPLPDDAVFAFPNPAKDSTTFRFLTPFAAPFDAVIDVFDIAGRLVKEIPGSQIQATATPALYHADWDLTNSRGQPLASGVYIYVVKVKDAGGTVVKVVKKLAVVR